MERKIDKEDKKFICPHFPAGVMNPEDLRRIADVCERFPESKIKLTGEIIIGGIKDDARNQECRKLLGIACSSVAGFFMRGVRVCSGGHICDNNQQDSFSLGLKLDRIFFGRRLPFKMIISVSGCRRCCSEPLVRDVAIVASKKGYSLFAGGAAGASPRIARHLFDGLSENEVSAAVDKAVALYEKEGRPAERLGVFIERFGFERFKERLIR